MEDRTERQIAHLAMIQAVIGRMASNSFALKALAVTLTAGVMALIGGSQKPSLLYPLGGVVAIAVFWCMDARYLHLENLYRALYEDVRLEREISPFDMDVSRYRDTCKPLRRIALSWSVNDIYVTLLGLLVLVAIGLWRAG
jgi:hypothetical protein